MVYFLFPERSEEGEPDWSRERPGAGALPGPGELYAQQTDQVCRSKDHYSRPLVNTLLQAQMVVVVVGGGGCRGRKP